MSVFSSVIIGAAGGNDDELGGMEGERAGGSELVIGLVQELALELAWKFEGHSRVKHFELR